MDAQKLKPAYVYKPVQLRSIKKIEDSRCYQLTWTATHYYLPDNPDDSYISKTIKETGTFLGDGPSDGYAENSHMIRNIKDCIRNKEEVVICCCADDPEIVMDLYRPIYDDDSDHVYPSVEISIRMTNKRGKVLVASGDLSDLDFSREE